MATSAAMATVATMTTMAPTGLNAALPLKSAIVAFEIASMAFIFECQWCRPCTVLSAIKICISLTVAALCPVSWNDS